MPTAQPFSEPGCWPSPEPEPWVAKCPSRAIEISIRCHFCLLIATRTRVLLAGPPVLLPGAWLAELLPQRRAPLPLLCCFQQWHLDLGLAPAFFRGWLRSWQRRAEEQLGKPGWQVVTARALGPPAVTSSPAQLHVGGLRRGQHGVATRGLVILATLSHQTTCDLCPGRTGEENLRVRLPPQRSGFRIRNTNLLLSLWEAQSSERLGIS